MYKLHNGVNNINVNVVRFKIMRVFLEIATVIDAEGDKQRKFV